jgi:hypothetical protein
MGSRSFSAWPQVEKILDDIPDGRNSWRHTHMPMVITTQEREGVPVVGRAFQSKSLLINEAIMHFVRRKELGSSCAEIRANLVAHQEIIKEQGEELERLKKKKGVRGLWHRIFG